MDKSQQNWLNPVTLLQPQFKFHLETTFQKEKDIVLQDCFPLGNSVFSKKPINSIGYSIKKKQKLRSYLVCLFIDLLPTAAVTMVDEHPAGSFLLG